jgi:NAD(P)-dependent dehydrogenase (short-subunit alcohol dehydrogenase family)
MLKRHEVEEVKVMKKRDLDNKDGKNRKVETVLVTGGAGGIGLCVAREFGKAGYHVIITDIDGEALARAALAVGEETGATIETHVVDVTDQPAVQALAETVLRKHGRLDVLVNNAGIGFHGELADTTFETWRRLVDVNFWGTLYHIYAFMPSMIRNQGGTIVNVSSGQAFFRLPTWGAYAAIKAALGAVSEILHFEVRKHGIHVTTVYPFMVNTPFYKDVRAETFGARMSMKLLPFYSMSPDKVGKVIFAAARRHANVEMVSVLNKLAFYGRVLPGFNDVVGRISMGLLAK